MCDNNDSQILSESDSENDFNDCSSNPPVDMGVHTVTDLKYYLITLGFTILTMLILKIVWKFTKCISINLVNKVDDLSSDFFTKTIKSKNNVQTEKSNSMQMQMQMQMKMPRVDSLQSNKLDAILYRNGNALHTTTKVRRSQSQTHSSTSSLRSISLTNDEDGKDGKDGSTGVIKRTDSEMSRTEKGVLVLESLESPYNVFEKCEPEMNIDIDNIQKRKYHVFGFVFTFNK